MTASLLPVTSRAKWGWVVFGILVIAVALRVGYVLEMPALAPAQDGLNYMSRALTLTRSGHMEMHSATIYVLVQQNGVQHTLAEHLRGPDAYWPPLYVFLLAALMRIYSLFGNIQGAIGGMTGMVLYVRIMLELLGIVSVVAIGLIGLRLFGRRVALVVLAIAAVFPPLIYMPFGLYSDALFVPLMLLSVLAMVKYHQERGRYTLILAAVLIGLSTMAREVGAVLVLPLIILAWPRGWRPRRPVSLRPFVPVVTALCAFALALAPWTIRNWVEFHHFIPLSLSGGNTLAGVYNPRAAALREVQWVPPKASVSMWYAYYSHADNQWQQNSDLQNYAITYAVNHPRYVLRVVYWNVRRLFDIQPLWYSAMLKSGIPPPVTLVGVIAFWILAALAIVGAFTRAARAGPAWFWLTPVVMVLSILVLTVDQARFKIPIDMFVMLLAALAIDEVLQRRPGRNRELRTDDRVGSGPGNGKHGIRAGEFGRLARANA